MTEYQASQIQRYYERQIRRWKREQKAMKAADQPTAESDRKVAEWTTRLNDFIKQTGFKKQYDRLRVD